MRHMPRGTDYAGLVHVIPAGAYSTWCKELFSVSRLTTILRKDKPQWDSPPTCLYCARLLYGS